MIFKKPQKKAAGEAGTNCLFSMIEIISEWFHDCNASPNDFEPCVQSGRAIQHVKENIFTAEGGMRRGIPNVLVVLTDGRSQDDVNKVSKEMQMEGQRCAVYKKSQ